MRKVILAVDDEKSALNSLHRLFRSRHYDFISFDSPVEALDAIKKIKPHIIISDKQMPGMEGIDFLSRAKLISQRSLRILLTGHLHPEDNNAKHIDRIMTKPWDNDELEYEVEKTTVHYDKIIIAKHGFYEMLKNSECSLCGSNDSDHEIRFENFTENICANCYTKLANYADSSMESIMMKQMMGNVL
jgi:response regulator RpfG family c-di-GMP phosphodiesterase